MVRRAEADVVNLLGRLPGRGDDHRLVCALGKTRELVQDRQEEGGGLAGARLGGGDEVPAGEDGGDGFRPDRVGPT